MQIPSIGGNPVEMRFTLADSIANPFKGNVNAPPYNRCQDLSRSFDGLVVEAIGDSWCFPRSGAGPCSACSNYCARTISK